MLSALPVRSALALNASASCTACSCLLNISSTAFILACFSWSIFAKTWSLPFRPAVAMSKLILSKSSCKSFVALPALVKASETLLTSLSSWPKPLLPPLPPLPTEPTFGTANPDKFTVPFGFFGAGASSVGAIVLPCTCFGAVLNTLLRKSQAFCAKSLKYFKALFSQALKSFTHSGQYPANLLNISPTISTAPSAIA